MSNHDVAHTSYSSSTGPATNSTIWIYSIKGEWPSSAISNGFVYVAGGDNVYALDASTGTLMWNYTARIPSTPTENNGVVYFGSDNECVYTLNATTGRLIWNYNSTGLQDSPNVLSGPTYGDTAISSPTILDGVVYVCSGDGNVFALNATTGTLLWDYLAVGGSSSPAVSNGIIYFSSMVEGSYGKVYALDAATGKLLWNFAPEFQTIQGIRFLGSPAVAYGVVYVGSSDAFYALNATNDSVMWNKTAKDPFSPAVANGVVYVGNQAFNAITGAYIMSYNAGKVRFSSPAVAGDIIYFGSEDQSVPPVVGRPVGGSIYAFNVTSGSLLWSYEANETDGSSPVVANGLVYIGLLDGKLYAFGPALTSSPSPTSVVSVGSGSSNIAIEIAAISIIIIAAAAVGLVLRRQHQQRKATFYKQNMPAHLTCSHRAFVFACALKTEKR